MSKGAQIIIVLVVFGIKRARIIVIRNVVAIKICVIHRCECCIVDGLGENKGGQVSVR